jgi:hypothetical protein
MSYSEAIIQVLRIGIANAVCRLGCPKLSEWIMPPRPKSLPPFKAPYRAP